MDVEPSDCIPDMESVWQNGSGALCFSRVVPMPALVLPKLLDNSGHRCIQSVRVSASKADSGSPMQSEGERCPSPSHSPFWPSQTWFSELTPLLYRPPWEIPIRWDLLSQLQGRIWHPQAELWKLWVWPIQGQGPMMMNLPVEVQETIASARAPATRKLYSSK